MDVSDAKNGKLRLGAVSYLNSKPLVYGLTEALPAARVRFDLPSRLADGLAAGDLDVALVPIIELLRSPELRLLSDACVACRGPVLSVKVYFRTPPGEVKSLALDEGSRTSAALAQVLLAEQHNVRPELQTLSIGQQVADSEADAVLLIGDRAMRRPSESFQETWDLGQRWREWTGLPFVFAAWVARSALPVDARSLAESLGHVRDAGVANVPSIVEAEAAKLGLDQQVARDYLARNLHFTLGQSERLGIERFAACCRSLSLIGSPIPSLDVFVNYDDCSTHQ